MDDLSRKVLNGDKRAASHLIRNLEDEIPGTNELMKDIYEATGNAHIIGLTGSPGAGKSTIADELIAAMRKRDKTVGVLAVDPTSPFTGGAILGDRVRMLRHSTDKDVFVRSLATRGYMGGLSKAVGDAIHVMEAMGKDKVIVETCGVGQQEVDIINHAQTVAVVLVPGMGDEVQAIKAGLMEIADIFVINKADREGTAKLYQEVLNLVAMSKRNVTGEDSWTIPVVKIGNTTNPEEFQSGVGTLYEKIEEHYKFLENSRLLFERKRRKTEAELKEALWSAIFQPVLKELSETGEMDIMINKLINKETDPYTLAEEVEKRYMK